MFIKLPNGDVVIPSHVVSIAAVPAYDSPTEAVRSFLPRVQVEKAAGGVLSAEVETIDVARSERDRLIAECEAWHASELDDPAPAATALTTLRLTITEGRLTTGEPDASATDKARLGAAMLVLRDDLLPIMPEGLLTGANVLRVIEKHRPLLASMGWTAIEVVEGLEP